jgi:L-asparaginase
MGAAVEAIRSGASALDVVEQGIRPVEADITVSSVGRGGSPNLLGEMECDAAIMDGSTLMCGAVGALRYYLHAITVARAVLMRLPHVMLVGPGAERFAAEVGAEKAEMLTEGALRQHEKWLDEKVRPEHKSAWPEVPLAEYAWESGKDYAAGGTVIFLARDNQGNIAAGTSTSGWARSYPGRLGDSPIIGAGLYADGRFGACACTHTGEMTIRTGAARSVVLYIKKGASVREACEEAMRDLLELEGGEIGPIVLHAIDFYGNPCVLTSHELHEQSSWYVWSERIPKVEHRQAEVVLPTASF